MGNQVTTPKENSVDVVSSSFEENKQDPSIKSSMEVTYVDDNSSSAPRKLPQQIMEEKGKLVSDCMLEQYFATAAGVGIGLAVGMHRRNARPFLVFATAGTIMDFVHGYTGPCRPLIEDFNAAVKDVKENERRGAAN